MSAGIAARLDRLPLSWLHIAIAALCAFGLLLDVAELSLSGALGTIFAAPPYSADATQLGLLLGSVFVGGVVGAPILGWLSDRHGRRLALQVSLFLVALPSLGGALSPDTTWLVVFRLLSGLALGAYPPLMSAFLADVLPPKRRAPTMLIGVAFGLLGWPVVALLIWWLTPLMPFGIDGWRWSLLIAGGLSVATALTFFLVPESPRWLATRGRSAEADSACRRLEAAARAAPLPAAADIVDSGTAPPSARMRGFGPHWPKVVLIATIYLMRPWSTVGFPLISGAVMIGKGYALDQSLMSIGIGGFGAAFGALLASFVVDRVERRTALTLCSLALVGAGLAFAIGDGMVLLIAAIAAFNFFAAIYGPVLSIYAAEIFPTVIRASATATAWSANRAGSAVAPLALLSVLQASGPIVVLATIAATLVANLVLILVFGPRGLAGLPLTA